MRNGRVLTAGLLGAALTLAAMAIPVSASAATSTDADANLVIGHGIPGTKVDICLRFEEAEFIVRSDFKYGQHFPASLPPGTYTFLTRAAAPRDCRGAVIIRQKFTLLEGDDLSVIATITRKKPQYAVFSNRVELAGTAVLEDWVSVKHAARIGAANVWVERLVPRRETAADGCDGCPGPGAPTIPVIRKGQSVDLPLMPTIDDPEGGPSVRIEVAKNPEFYSPNGGTPFKASAWFKAKPGFVNHYVMVGAKKNLRVLRYRTGGSLGAP